MEISFHLIFAIFIAVSFTGVNSEVITDKEITPHEMNGMLETIDTYFFNPSPIFNLEIRKFIRGAFHDCIGGCDGSLNITNPPNRGLEEMPKAITSSFSLATNPLNTSNAAAFQKLSRADYWALLVQRAVGWAIRRGA